MENLRDNKQWNEDRTLTQKLLDIPVLYWVGPKFVHNVLGENPNKHLGRPNRKENR